MLFFFAVIAGLTLTGSSMLFGYARSHGGPDMGGGRTALLILAYVQQSLITLIMPAYAGASIALEREKRTIELLYLSGLSPTDIVSGKLLTIGAFAAMLLVATLPVAVWCLMLGGVSPLQVLMRYSYLLVVAIDVIAAGLFISTTTDRALPAVVATYALVYFGGSILSGAGMVMLGLSAMRGAPSALGRGGAIALTLVVAAVFSATAYLIGLGVRRRCARPWSAVVAALPAAAAVVVALVTFGAGYLWSPVASGWSGQALMVTSPRGAIGAILGGESILGLSGSGKMPPAVLV